MPNSGPAPPLPYAVSRCGNPPEGRSEVLFQGCDRLLAQRRLDLPVVALRSEDVATPVKPT